MEGRCIADPSSMRRGWVVGSAGSQSPDQDVVAIDASPMQVRCEREPIAPDRDAITGAISDGAPMAGRQKLYLGVRRGYVLDMPSISPYRKPPRTPPGYEDHLTRQQAAQLLGFSSEFKIRQLEREGRLQSVRGPMRTAFYPRAQVLAVKAELGQGSPGQASADPETDGGWTDAELLVLLGNPTRAGRARGALDLVLETRINIERAERVFAFWSNARPAGAAPLDRAATARPSPPASARLRHPQPSSPTPAAASEPVPDLVSPAATLEMPVVASATPHTEAAIAKAAPVMVAQPLPTPLPSDRGSQERRSEKRLSRDGLIQQLRDPDPRVRDRAFVMLKECQAGG
jgi:hypothetical protein